jgi:chromate transporter
VFLKLGLTSFGGPIAHIGYFQRTFVEQKKWLDDAEFSQLLALCQFLPGPASSQLGFAIGYNRSGWLGALAAFVGFTLPSAVFLVVFASLLPYLESNLGALIIHGLKLVALVVVADAVLSMSEKLCRTKLTQSIAVGSAAGAICLSAGWVQLVIVLLAMVVGSLFIKDTAGSRGKTPVVPLARRTSIAALSVFGVLLGLALLPLFQSDISVLAQLFYRAGALVFGGGHVVLPFLQDGMVQQGIISNDAFLAGYGAAQAVPGPMFSFAAYLGSVGIGEPVSILGACIGILAIFAPGFLLLTSVLPFWPVISRNQTLLNAFTGVSAAVVGLLAAALYNPIFTSSVTRSEDLVIALGGFALLTVWKLSPLWVVLWCVGLSVLGVYWV